MVAFAVDLPPSAKRVLVVLASHGPQTHKDLVRMTHLPPRTLRFALHRLRTTGWVGWRWNLRDPRQRVYFLEPDGVTRAPS